MKFLIAISFLALAACGGAGGGADKSAPHIPDSTPHVYEAAFFPVDNDTLVHTGHLHQICYESNGGFRDVSSDITLTTAFGGGVGCGDGGGFPNAVKLDLVATNTGTLSVYLVIRIDYVQQPTITLAPAEAYTLQRGY